MTEFVDDTAERLADEIAHRCEDLAAELCDAAGHPLLPEGICPCGAEDRPTTIDREEQHEPTD